MPEVPHRPGNGQQLTGTMIIMALLLLMIVVLWLYSYSLVVSRG